MATDALYQGKSTAEADRFSAIFRAEHRHTRDLLLDLIDAYKKDDKARIPGLLTEIAAVTGPHFRYEEEVLYPALVPYFGPEYVRELFHAHDRAIATARELVSLTRKESLTPEEVDRAIHGARAILPHVTDCDGLSVLVERFPASRVAEIFAARDKARSANLDLLTWDEQVRRRAGEAVN